MIVQLVGGEAHGQVLFIPVPWESPYIFHAGQSYFLRHEEYKQLGWTYLYYKFL